MKQTLLVLMLAVLSFGEAGGFETPDTTVIYKTIGVDKDGSVMIWFDDDPDSLEIIQEPIHGIAEIVDVGVGESAIKYTNVVTRMGYVSEVDSLICKGTKENGDVIYYHYSIDILSYTAISETVSPSLNVNNVIHKEINIYTLNGRLVQKFDNETINSINIKHLPKGIYFARIPTGITKKMMVK